MRLLKFALGRPRQKEQVCANTVVIIGNKCAAAERGGTASEVGEMRDWVWVKPQVKCEVEFEERTHGGHLRHASFRQLLGRNGVIGLCAKYAGEP